MFSPVTMFVFTLSFPSRLPATAGWALPPQTLVPALGGKSRMMKGRRRPLGTVRLWSSGRQADQMEAGWLSGWSCHCYTVVTTNLASTLQEFHPRAPRLHFVSDPRRASRVTEPRRWQKREKKRQRRCLFRCLVEWQFVCDNLRARYCFPKCREIYLRCEHVYKTYIHWAYIVLFVYISLNIYCI